MNPAPANRDRIIHWARDYWQALHPYSAGAAYVNFMMEEGRGRVELTYGPNYQRLRAIKRKYDPENFFHINQNIDPERDDCWTLSDNEQGLWDQTAELDRIPAAIH